MQEKLLVILLLRGRASSLAAVKCHNDGSIANTTSNILHHVSSSFIKSLLMEAADNHDEISVFLFSVPMNPASLDVEYLDSVVTLDEYHEAVHSLQPGKSLGSHDLPTEFYQRFCNILGSDLAEVLKNASALLCSLALFILGIFDCRTSKVTQKIFVTGSLSRCSKRNIKF